MIFPDVYSGVGRLQAKLRTTSEGISPCIIFALLGNIYYSGICLHK